MSDTGSKRGGAGIAKIPSWVKSPESPDFERRRRNIMQKELFKEKYPIYKATVARNECRFKDIDEIAEYLKGEIEGHPVAVYIALFDHYKHTKSLAEGYVSADISGAKDVVFCFGKELKVPDVLAVRPRSIGICESGDNFVISFMEAPNPQANEAMIKWVESIENR